MGETTTDFSQYSHAELKSMVDSLNSGDVMKAADPWRRAYDTLKGIRTALQSYSGQATTDWDGQASDAFYTRMTKLATSVNNAAEYANNTAVTLEIVSDSIDEAKATMPDEPSAWQSGTDWVDDKVSGLLGADDSDTRQSEADTRKQQAVAVMQTLATRYRNSAAVLKPPGKGVEDPDEAWPPPPQDPTGAGAIGGVIIGAGLGGMAGASGGGHSSGGAKRGGSAGGQSSLGVAAALPALKDPAIQGGMATPATHPPAPLGGGTGTSLDGAVSGVAGGTRMPSAGSGMPGGNLSAGGIGGGLPAVGGGVGGSARVAGGLAAGAGRGAPPASGAGRPAGGRGRSGAAVPGETPTREGAARTGGGYGPAGGSGGGLGAASRGGAGRGSGLARRSGGVVGESLRGGRGGAFTEGGTGLGSRSRSGQSANPGQSVGGLAGRGRKRDEERQGERPDYLVEDDETWIGGPHPNPDVVE